MVKKMIDKKKDSDKKTSKKNKEPGKNFDPVKYIETEPSLDETKEDINEILTISQRRARGRMMKRLAPRIARKRKIAMKRKASSEKLQLRALKKARNLVKTKLAGGKKYSDLSVSQRMQIDKRAASKTALIKRIAKKEFPQVRRAEMERVKKMRSQKEEFDVNEQFELFMEAKKMKDDPCWDDHEMIVKKKKNGKEVPNCVPKEEIEKDCGCEDERPKKRRFHRLLDNDCKPVIDRRFKIYRKAENPNFYDYAEGAIKLASLIKENFGDDPTVPSTYGNFRKGDTVEFNHHSMDMVDDIETTRRGEVVGSTVSHLRVRCSDGKLYKVRHQDAVNLDSTISMKEAVSLSKLSERSFIDKAILIMHKHVLKGKDFADVAFDIAKMTGSEINSRELMRAYVDKFGEPAKAKVSQSSANRLRKKYL